VRHLLLFPCRNLRSDCQKVVLGAAAPTRVFGSQPAIPQLSISRISASLFVSSVWNSACPR
jgi:hypothetical protein